MSHTERSFLHEICHYVISNIKKETVVSNEFEATLMKAGQITLDKNFSSMKTLRGFITIQKEKRKTRKFTFKKVSNVYFNYNKKDIPEELLCETYGVLQYIQRHNTRKKYAEKDFREMLDFHDRYFQKKLNEYFLSHPLPENQINCTLGEILETIKSKEEIKMIYDIKKIAHNYLHNEMKEDKSNLPISLKQKLNLPVSVAVTGTNSIVIENFMKGIIDNEYMEENMSTAMLGDGIILKPLRPNSNISSVFNENFDMLIYVVNKNFSENNKNDLNELKKIFKDKLLIVTNVLEEFTYGNGMKKGLVDEESMNLYRREIAHNLKEMQVKYDDIFVVGLNRNKKIAENGRIESLEILVNAIAILGEDVKVKRYNKYLGVFSDMVLSENNATHKKGFIDGDSFLDKMKEKIFPEIKEPILEARKKYNELRDKDGSYL
jgi:hypothetical protein